MDTKRHDVCGRCRHYHPHDLFAFIGLCAHTHDLVIKAAARDGCDAFEEPSVESHRRVLRRQGWLRCYSCHRVLFAIEELLAHQDDAVGGSVFSDTVAAEEAPTAG